MGKIKIEENSEFTLKYPDSMISRMEVVTRSGERLVEMASLPKGHPGNPITDTELEQKFLSLAGAVLTQERCRRALDLLWNFEEIEDIGAVFEALEL